MAKDTFLNGKHTFESKGKTIDFSQPLVMAILNLTPDSFYADSRASNISDALKQAEKAILAGAEILDIGAYSSRPNAVDISEEEELQRLTPTVEAIASAFPAAILSIDTFRANVAKAAIVAGGHIINDISGSNLDANMFKTVAQLKVPYILMHMRGTPQNMQQNTDYKNVTEDVLQYFKTKIGELNALGVNDIIIDPGFGFAKTLEQNYELLDNLSDLNQFGLPVLAGFSRKSMVTKLLDIKAEDALNGTTVLNTIALLKGAAILRVHDVKEAVQCVKVVSCLVG